MPQYLRKDDKYFVSYVTGPSHVLVGVSFGAADASPDIHRQSRLAQCDHGSLDEARILEAVAAGVAAANVELHLASVFYFEGDSPSYDLYKHCGKLLAQRVAAGGEFSPMAENDA